MRQFVDSLRISTHGRGLVEITREVLDWLQPRGVQTGLLTLFCRHTSAGLLIQENAAADVRADLMQGRLALGTWQGIYLFEHRRTPRRLEIALHLIGE